MIRNIFQILLILLSISFANEDANTLYNTIKGVYGGKDSINNNINKPATGSSDFKTVDNSQTFSAPMECPSQAKAIIIQFTSTSGDHTAYIKVDTNLDGAFDYFYTTPNISGVCTNGIVSCTPGTWNNCKYYYWEAPNKKPKLIETVDTSKTGTCSCANISCGVTTLDQPLFSLIGGGISQAIMKTDSRFLLSKSKWNGNTLELYGQDTQNCTNPNFNSYGDKNPTQYYNNQTYPDIDIATIEAQQSNDNTSPYSVVSQTSSLEYEHGKQIGMPSVQECVIRNSPYVSQQVYYSDGGCYYGNTNPCSGSLVNLQDNIYKCKWTPGNNGCGPKWEINICGKWETSWSIPDDEVEYIKINGSVIRNVYRKGEGTESGSGSCSGDTTKGTASCNGKGYVASPDFVVGKFSYKNAGACNGRAVGTLYTYLVKLDEFANSTSNTCPTNCELVDEWVCDKDGNNCIQTVIDGNPLLVSLQPQCFNYTTDLSTYVICSDGNNITVSNPYTGQKIIGSGWFYVKRKYNCGTQTLDVDLSRTKKVVQNTTLDNQTISYTDVDGSKDSFEPNIKINNCPVPVCTVKVARKDTQVFSDKTNRSQIPSGTDTNELEVRTCNVDANGNKTCPLSTGETLVEDCKCDIGEQRVGFQTAVTSLQVLNEASKDIICSSSPP